MMDKDIVLVLGFIIGGILILIGMVSLNIFVLIGLPLPWFIWAYIEYKELKSLKNG